MPKYIKMENIQRATDAGLSPITQNILDLTQNKEAYAEAGKEVATIAEKQATYIMALAVAQNKGKDRVLAKNTARKELENAAEKLAVKLEDLRPGDKKYYVDAGFELKTEQKSGVKEIDPPIFVRASVQTEEGVSKLKINVEFPDLISLYYIEYCVKGTDIWLRSKSTTKRNVDVRDLPSGKRVTFRVAAVGSGTGNVSAWVYSNEIPVL